MTIQIGTSGWHYKSWVGPFYPPALPSSQMLAFYAREFGTVEVNSSFYKLPADETMRQWAEATPGDFVFAYKASRYLTHRKKLIAPQEPLARMLRSAELLGPKLGPILFLLPPRWRLNLERLRAFLALLPAGRRFVFEFRDGSWLTEPVYEALREANAGLCIAEFGYVRSPLLVTADFAYVRLHGPAGRYGGLYDRGALARWAGQISAWESEGTDTYFYFDNDEQGFAVRNARELRQMVGA